MTSLTPYPTFIDLRAFAAAARPAADPFGRGRTVLPLRPAPVEVGAVALTAGAGKVGPLAGDWWLVAATGAVTITANGSTITVSGDQTCVLPAGSSFAWRAGADATLLYMCYTAAQPGQADVTPLDLTVELAPSGAPLAELLVGETPSCRNHTHFRSADGAFTCGLWDSTPYHRRAMRYAHFELMLLLAGSVGFVDEAGRAATFGRGDIFLVEQGASCSWDSREDVTKIFAIYRPVA